MKPKYFYTQRGAANHAAKVQAVWQNLVTRVRSEINLCFRTVYFVEVRHPSEYGQWMRCGAFSRRAMRVAPDGTTLGLLRDA